MSQSAVLWTESTCVKGAQMKTFQVNVIVWKRPKIQWELTSKDTSKVYTKNNPKHEIQHLQWQKCFLNQASNIYGILPAFLKTWPGGILGCQRRKRFVYCFVRCRIHEIWRYADSNRRVWSKKQQSWGWVESLIAHTWHCRAMIWLRFIRRHHARQSTELPWPLCIHWAPLEAEFFSNREPRVSFRSQLLPQSLELDKASQLTC